MKNITINISKNHVTEVVIEYRISQQISTHESRSRISGGLEDISLETWSRLSGGGVFEDIRGWEGEANIDMSTRDSRATTLGQLGFDRSYVSIYVNENYQCKTSMIEERRKSHRYWRERRCVSKEDMILFALIMQGISREHLVNRMGIFFALLENLHTGQEIFHTHNVKGPRQIEKDKSPHYTVLFNWTRINRLTLLLYFSRRQNSCLVLYWTICSGRSRRVYLQTISWNGFSKQTIQSHVAAFQ